MFDKCMRLRKVLKGGKLGEGSWELRLLQLPVPLKLLKTAVNSFSKCPTGVAHNNSDCRDTAKEISHSGLFHLHKQQ